MAIEMVIESPRLSPNLQIIRHAARIRNGLIHVQS